MRTITVLLLGTMLVSSAAADFCDGNFIVDAGDWDDIAIHEGGTLKRASYNWRERQSYRWNRARMTDPTRFNMPAGTKLHSPPSMRYAAGGGAFAYISWLAVYDVQYTYTVVCDGVTYTNDTASMSYRASWLETPCIHYSDMNRYVDKVTATPSNGGVKFRVWQHFTKNNGNKYYSYGEKTIPAGIEDVRAWETPNADITVTLTNSSMGYYILDAPIPPGALGYRIDARSDSHDAFYKYTHHMMQRNVTSSGKEFFEVVKAPNTNCRGMAAGGINKFILPEATNYNINVTVYTPFEQIKMNVSMIREEREVKTVDKRSMLRSLIALLMMPFGIYFLIRSMG